MVDFKRTGGLPYIPPAGNQGTTNGAEGETFSLSALRNMEATTGLDLSLPLDYSAGDRFEIGGNTDKPAFDPKLKAATDRFESRMNSILGHDAMSLANGVTPYQPGMELTDGQRDKMVDAAKDLLKDVPLEHLAPGLIATIRGAVGAENLKGSSLNDLGDAGSTMAKNFAENLRNESPAVFYGLAGTAAVAAGALAYTQGSDALKSVGLKPEFKTGLFNNRLEAKVSAEWGPKFSDPGVELDMGTNILLGRSGRLRAGATIDTDGNSAVRLNGSFNHGNWTGSGEAILESDGDFRAGLRAGWKPNENTEFAVSGSVDNRGESRVGVGFKINF